MSLETCTKCDKNFLSEAEAYVVFPHSTGYHLFCLDCGKEGIGKMLKAIEGKFGSRAYGHGGE